MLAPLVAYTLSMVQITTPALSSDDSEVMRNKVPSSKVADARNAASARAHYGT